MARILCSGLDRIGLTGSFASLVCLLAFLLCAAPAASAVVEPLQSMTLGITESGKPPNFRKFPDGDRYLHGAVLYTSWAHSSMEIWWNYDPAEMENNIDLATQLDLNCLCIYLSYEAYRLDRAAFLQNLQHFLTTCGRKDILPFLVIFDSCFGLSPGVNTAGLFYTANPGWPLTNPDFYEDGEEYVDDVLDKVLVFIDRYVEPGEYVLIDVMNEPHSTPYANLKKGVYPDYLYLHDPDLSGYAQICYFAQHFVNYIQADPDYDAIKLTLGLSPLPEKIGTGREQYNIDVYSIHCFDTMPAFENKVLDTLDMLDTYLGGMPLMVQCGYPGNGQLYGDVMPFLHEEKVNNCFWVQMVGANCLKGQIGVFYSDGKVRDVDEARAIKNDPDALFVKKEANEPDYVPFMSIVDEKPLYKEALIRMDGSPTTEIESCSEAWTLLRGLATAQLDGPRDYFDSDPHAEEILGGVDLLVFYLGQGLIQEAFAQTDHLIDLALLYWEDEG